ncbi:MAG: hypothetical protein WC444_04190 [Candidatus Paceibacterota bacterium]
MIDRETLLNAVGDFSWLWNDCFFIETEEHGNFLWSDPEYRGDNTIRKTDMSLKEYLTVVGVPYGRSKGKHIIRRYVGEDAICV